MPFQSRAQQRFAFGTKQPWAKRWAKETTFAGLPERKDAGTDAGAPLHGPGGLLSMPGMGMRRPRKGRKWGMRLKDKLIKGKLYRADDGKFSSGSGSSDAPVVAVTPGRRGAKRPKQPRQTDAQRQEARAAKRQQNTADVAKRMADTDTGLSPSGVKALTAFASGTQPDPQTGAGLAKMGLAEQATDGSYRMSATGRAAVNAMAAGDYQRTVDAISRGTDASGKRTQRQTERAARQQATAAKRQEAEAKRQARRAEVAARRAAKPAKASGGGDKKKLEATPAETPTKARPAKRSSARMPSGGGVAGAAGNKKPVVEPKPEQAPAKQIAPALQEAAQQLSEGSQALTGTALNNLVRNGLAWIDKDGFPVLTAAGLRATMKAQTPQEKAIFAKLGGGGSGGSGGSAGGGSKLWAKNDAGKRVPQAGFEGKKRAPSGGEGKARAADPGKPAHGQTVGNVTKAYGADPTTSYSMRHELVDMGDINASNTAGGGINPKYDPTLQPRDRSRASSQAQIADVAQKMNPDVLTTDFHRIDSGSPIIDAKGNVLSGNGRTLALQRAAEMHPEKYADYKASIRAQAKEAGIDPSAVDKMKNPVLVRRLEPGTDTAAFAREANSSGTLRMSPLEQAKVDAGTISNPHMLKLHVTEGQDIDRSLRDKANKPFIDDFLATVPPNERANLLTRNGELNQMGLYRVKAAVYMRAFPGAAGERMAESMLESLDPDVKQIQNGISGGLPSLSRAQSLIRSGHRESNLDISEDLAKTVDVYARIKDNPALTANTPANRLVAKYLGQTSMFGRELSDEQERLLVHVDSMSRSPTRVRSFLERYARIVENEPQPGQSNLFGDAGNLTRAQLFDALLAEDSTTKAAMKAKRPMRGDLPPLPPVRKRADYSDIKASDLVMALFHDKIAPLTAMRAEFDVAEKAFIVYKDHAGQHRWLARTTTAYRDRDGEIISSDALDQDSQRMTAARSFGPLRYWHVGQPDPFDVAQPWGPGLDIGDCDYSCLIGRTRIEGGTFRDPVIARKVAGQSDQYELSPGFFHPLDQPGADGVFHAIRTFERSIVPTKYGRASNLFTGLAVKESRMDIGEMEKRFKAAISDLGLDAAQAQALGAQLVQTEKDATAQGIAFKAETQDVASYPDVEINGVVYKAFPAKVAAPPMEAMAPDEETIEETVEEGAIEEPGEEPMEGDYIGDMSWDAFAAKLSELLAPVLKMQDMMKAMGDMHGELKTMYGGVAQKDDARAAELIALKSQLSELTAKIADIEGDQPSIVLPDEVAEAMKSAGPAKPATPEHPATAAAINDPTRPLAWLGMQTFPELYNQNGETT